MLLASKKLYDLHARFCQRTISSVGSRQNTDTTGAGALVGKDDSKGVVPQWICKRVLDFCNNVLLADEYIFYQFNYYQDKSFKDHWID